MRFVSACLISLLPAVQSVPAQDLQDPAGRAVERETPRYRSFQELLSAFAKTKTFSAAFAEERRIELLIKPVLGSGRIYYHAASQNFARHFEKPFANLLVVDPRQMAMREGQEWTTLDLERQPLVSQFLAAFLKILQGDGKGLQELYVVRFTAPEADAEDPLWKLVLEPRLSPMNKVIASVSLAGRGLELVEMRVLETCGDQTITTFHDVEVDREFTPKEMLLLFPKPPGEARDR